MDDLQTDVASGIISAEKVDGHLESTCEPKKIRLSYGQEMHDHFGGDKDRAFLDHFGCDIHRAFIDHFGGDSSSPQNHYIVHLLTILGAIKELISHASGNFFYFFYFFYG